MSLAAPPDHYHTHTQADGSTIGYFDYGPADGTPLLFFHGWPSTGRQAAALAPLAHQYDLRIISPDRPGIGSSTRCPGRTFTSILPELEMLLRSLEIDTFYAVGVSGGGPYALAVAHGWPTRVLAAVSCSGAPPLAEVGARRHLHWAYRSLLACQRFSPRLLRQLLRLPVWAARWQPPWPLMRPLLCFMPPRDRLALGDEANFHLYYPCFTGAMRSGHDAVCDDGECYIAPWPFDPAEIRVPTHIWHGSQDVNFHHSLAAALAARIPHAQFHLREEGHYSLPIFWAAEILQTMLQSARTPF